MILTKEDAVLILHLIQHLGVAATTLPDRRVKFGLPESLASGTLEALITKLYIAADRRDLLPEGLVTDYIC